ncbi:uncharacterized protein LOC144441264 [Glandiceps talaboti]
MAVVPRTPNSLLLLETITEKSLEDEPVLTQEEKERLRAEYTREKVEKGFRFRQHTHSSGHSRCKHGHHSGKEWSPKTSPKRIRRAKHQPKQEDETNNKTGTDMGRPKSREKTPIETNDLGRDMGRPKSREKTPVETTVVTKGPKVRPWSSVGEKGRKDGRKSPHERPKTATAVRGDEIVVRPWSVTELLDDDQGESKEEIDNEMEIETEKAKWVWTPKKEEEAVEEKPEESERPSLRTVQSFQELLEGPKVTDADYDTDLEEDFPPDPEREYDPSGTNIYLEQCRKEGVIPISYVIRHLRDPVMRMRHHYLGYKQTKPLARAMTDNPFVEDLDLVDNHLEEGGAVALATMLRENANITKLDISENFIYSRGAAAMFSMLETNYALKSLSLRSNHLTDGDAKILSEALKNNSTLIELDLSHNELGELAGIHLAPGLAENNSVSRLNLSWNSIRGKGSVALFNALKANSILEMLDLSWNGIALPGCQALGRALKVNTTLRILNLSNNHINLDAAKKLVIGLKKNIGLEVLMMGSNPLGDEGIMTLLVPMHKHRTLRIFTLQGLTVPTGIQAKIEDLMNSRDIYVLHAGVGGYKRQRTTSSTVSMVEQFINDNQLGVLDGCLQKDVEKCNMIPFLDVLEILQESGLKMSEEQVDRLLDHTNLQRTTKIHYRALLAGFSSLRVGQFTEPDASEY